MIIKKLLIIFIFLPVIARSESLKEQAEQVILNKLGADASLHFEKYDIPAEIKIRVQNQSPQKFYSRFVYYWEITKNDSPIAHAILDNVKGKSALITFLVIIDENDRI